MPPKPLRNHASFSTDMKHTRLVKVPNFTKEEIIITSSTRQEGYPPVGRSYSVPRIYTVLTNGKRYWLRVIAQSMVLIKEHGWILLPVRTGSCTFRMSALMGAWYICNP